MAIETQGGGALPAGGSGASIQVAYGVMNRDAESTPNESPLTVSDTVDEIKIPVNAALVVFTAVDADCRFGDNNTLDGAANKGYDIVLENSIRAVPCAGGASIFVKRDAAVSVKLYYSFEKMDLLIT